MGFFDARLVAGIHHHVHQGSGVGGINFGSFGVKRVILHTHLSPTGPSALDFQMLKQTKQASSYVYELFGGGLTKFYNK